MRLGLARPRPSISKSFCAIVLSFFPETRGPYSDSLQAEGGEREGGEQEWGRAGEKVTKFWRSGRCQDQHRIPRGEGKWEVGPLYR